MLRDWISGTPPPYRNSSQRVIPRLGFWAIQVSFNRRATLCRLGALSLLRVRYLRSSDA